MIAQVGFPKSESRLFQIRSDLVDTAGFAREDKEVGGITTSGGGLVTRLVKSSAGCAGGGEGDRRHRPHSAQEEVHKVTAGVCTRECVEVGTVDQYPGEGQAGHHLLLHQEQMTAGPGGGTHPPRHHQETQCGRDQGQGRKLVTQDKGFFNKDYAPL